MELKLILNITERRHLLKSSSGHPTNESFTKSAQSSARIANSSLVIHGVTLSSFKLLKFGILVLKLNEDMPPKQ